MGVSARCSGGCALREDGELACQSGLFDESGPPDGPFRSIGGSCAIHENGELVCWREGFLDDGAPQPAGRFTAVSVGRAHLKRAHLYATPDTGSLTGGTACAIRESGEAVCWGNNDYGQADAPSGRFTAVSVGGAHACGLQESDELECWGDNNFYSQTDAPEGRFRALSTGLYHSCAIRESGELACWGALTPAATVPDALR